MQLKNLTFLILTFFIMGSSPSTFYAQDSTFIWLTNLEEAKEQAVEESKNILLYFSGSDWCVPCMQLKKEVLLHESFKKLAGKNFIGVAFDFPAQSENLLPEEQQKYNEAKAEIYNKDGSFPLILLLDSEGNELGKIKGYAREGTDKYLSKLKSILDKNK